MPDEFRKFKNEYVKNGFLLLLVSTCKSIISDFAGFECIKKSEPCHNNLLLSDSMLVWIVKEER